MVERRRHTRNLVSQSHYINTQNREATKRIKKLQPDSMPERMEETTGVPNPVQIKYADHHLVPNGILNQHEG